MRFLKRYWKTYRRAIFTGQFFKLIEAVLELILPLVMADLLDRGLANGDVGLIWRDGLWMLLLAAVGMGMALVCQVVATRASADFGARLRHDVYAHINTLPCQALDGIGAASLVTRVTGDVNQLQQALAMLIRLVVRAPFLALGAMVMAVILDVQLSLVFICSAPLIALALYVIMRRALPSYGKMQSKLDAISRITRENLSGARVVRAFNREQTERGRFGEASEQYTVTAVRVSKLSALLTPVTSVLMNLGVLAVLLLGGARVQNGLLSQGVVIAFINYLAQILLQTTIVANLVVLFTRAGASAKRVGEVLAMDNPISQDAGAQGAETDAAVEFNHVSFSYHTQRVLEDIGFTLPKGQTLGVIGGTGAGKSTLAALLMRLYDADEGVITFMGQNIRALDPQALRARIGCVPQGAALRSGTVRENLLWGDETADDTRLWEALEVAQADAFVRRLDGGLDHVLSQGGRGLSGGQKQRLTIARALVRRPELFIMDDASSALDYATDAALRCALRQRMRGMTVMIISQRISAIKDADRILVLDDGRVAGIGTHEQLLESCAVYRDICQSQEKNTEVSA